MLSARKVPERMPIFVPALTNALRERGVTTLMTVEIDAYIGSELTVPVPVASAEQLQVTMPPPSRAESTLGGQARGVAAFS